MISFNRFIKEQETAPTAAPASAAASPNAAGAVEISVPDVPPELTGEGPEEKKDETKPEDQNQEQKPEEKVKPAITPEDAKRLKDSLIKRFNDETLDKSFIALEPYEPASDKDSKELAFRISVRSSDPYIDAKKYQGMIFTNSILDKDIEAIASSLNIPKIDWKIDGDVKYGVVKTE